MAELVPAPAPAVVSTGEQLRAIAAVRWRLMLNSMRTTRGTLELVARIWTGFWFTLLAFAGFVGFAFATRYFLLNGEANWLGVLLWPLFLFWQVFPLAASAFAEQADSSYLTRFPLRYSAYVVVRIAFGAVDVATLVGCGCTLGLVIGVGLGAPGLLLWAVAAAALYVAFNVLLSQAIFAWLERWLARRRTREILALLFFLALFSINFIGPITRRWEARAHPGATSQLQRLLPLEHWLPPGLPAQVLSRAGQTEVLAGLGALALLALWAVVLFELLGLRLRADFRGETLSDSGRPKKTRAAPVRPSAPPVAAGAGGWTLPQSPALAVARKELRYLFRSPMMLFTLVMPVLLLLLFRFQIQAGNPARARLRHGPHFNAAGLGFPVGIAYAVLVLTNLVFNSLGTDAVGVQFYFVAPVRFRQVLIGKNLAYCVILLVDVVVLAIIASAIDGMPNSWLLAVTLLGLVFAAISDFTCGNLCSLFLPKKIDLSRLGRQGARTTSGVTALAIQGVVAGLIAVAIFGGIVFGRRWLSLLVLGVLAAAAAAVYFVVLGQCDAIAQQRRETIIAELSKA